MTPSPNRGDDHSQPPSSSTVILLLVTMGDTTWRMFVPTIGLMVLGLWADHVFGTKPWLMTLGLVVGTFLAGVLVKDQLKRVKK
jgi:hypothetical protein